MAVFGQRFGDSVWLFSISVYRGVDGEAFALRLGGVDELLTINLTLNMRESSEDAYDISG